MPVTPSTVGMMSHETFLVRTSQDRVSLQIFGISLAPLARHDNANLPFSVLYNAAIFRPREPTWTLLGYLCSLKNSYDIRRFLSLAFGYTPDSKIAILSLGRKHVRLLL